MQRQRGSLQQQLQTAQQAVTDAEAAAEGTKTTAEQGRLESDSRAIHLQNQVSDLQQQLELAQRAVTVAETAAEVSNAAAEEGRCQADSRSAQMQSQVTDLQQQLETAQKAVTAAETAAESTTAAAEQGRLQADQRSLQMERQHSELAVAWAYATDLSERLYESNCAVAEFSYQLREAEYSVLEADPAETERMRTALQVSNTKLCQSLVKHCCQEQAIHVCTLHKCTHKMYAYVMLSSRLVLQHQHCHMLMKNPLSSSVHVTKTHATSKYWNAYRSKHKFELALNMPTVWFDCSQTAVHEHVHSQC